MQKLSACRKRLSSIHFFSSTTTRCMIAICPAGPPKLMKPSLSQKRNASAKLGLTTVPLTSAGVFRTDAKGNAAARRKLSRNAGATRRTGGDKVIEDAIRRRFVEGAL